MILHSHVRECFHNVDGENLFGAANCPCPRGCPRKTAHLIPHKSVLALTSVGVTAVSAGD
jgi:hypothetical protein